MQWKDFQLGDELYSLSHLHPFTFKVVVPASEKMPERSYDLNVIFSLHCFTRSCREDEELPPDLAYSDNRETRIFDIDRYQLSMELPGIVRGLAERKCYHDKHGNFYVFEIRDGDGSIKYYSVFFSVTKSGKKSGLNLFISTAHLRPEPPYAKAKKPIRFRIILHNVAVGKPIARPR